VSGTKRQSWSYQAGGTVGPPITTAQGPDELTYRSEPFNTASALAGPISATLYAQATGIDTEFFVDLIDEGPDGTHTYLQRGLLRASHRAVDDSRSDKTPGGEIYRPFHPHTNPTNIAPGETNKYVVEVFPVGHVFRPGHRLVVKISAPPVVDSYYAYIPRSAPTINTLLSGPDTPSHILLPFVPLTGVQLGPELACGAQEAVRCVRDPDGAGSGLPVLPTLPPVTVPPATLPPTTLAAPLPGLTLPKIG
jgi:predicted acyl esterase